MLQEFFLTLIIACFARKFYFAQFYFVYNFMRISSFSGLLFETDMLHDACSNNK